MNPAGTASLPTTSAVAFKEWQGVCNALASGRQSLILRKGGIEEGPGGFVPEHGAFWLYPTQVHQAQQGLRPEAQEVGVPEPETPEGTIGLGTLAVVAMVGRVERIEQLPALESLHVWTAETVEARFRYRRPGLWVLGVRVFRREHPAIVAVTPEQAGCKSWVPLESTLTTEGLTPAIDDQAFAGRMEDLRRRLGAS